MLYLVTSNLHKLKEFQQLLPFPIQNVAIDLLEIQTTDRHALIQNKLQQAYAQTQAPVLVEDTSLYFEAWNQLPGTLTKWFLQNLGGAGLFKALQPFQNFKAQAVCCIGYTPDGKVFHYFEGELSGHIVSPRGEGGFGWDPIFQPLGSFLTFGQMGQEEKNFISMRQKAIGALSLFLERQAGQR